MNPPKLPSGQHACTGSGTYVGAGRDDSGNSLNGQGALVHASNEKAATVYVQFNDRGLGRLAYGWHPYPASDWRVSWQPKDTDS